MFDYDDFPLPAIIGGVIFAAVMMLGVLNVTILLGPTPVQVTVTAPPPAAGAAITTAGVLTVGADLDPGAYQTLAGPTCYWALLDATTGRQDDVAASGHGAGPVGIDVTGHAALATTGCGNWTGAAHAPRRWTWLP